MIKILGLDIGISSIGWSLVEVETQNKINDGNIIDCGVRLFSEAENPKDGKSLALNRRISRGARRANKRKKSRINQVKILLSKYFDIEPKKMIAQDEFLPNLFATNKDFISPWELRAQGLDRKLNEEEFSRVLLHIAKRRGYDDSRGFEEEEQKDEKDEEKDKKKVILKSIQSNREEMQKNGYRTIGEMMCKEYFSKEKSKGNYYSVRNRNKTNKNKNNTEDSKDGYKRSIGRKDLQEEIKILFDAQRNFGNKRATAEFEESFNKIAFHQRELKSFESMVGKCEFYPDEKRASKCCYSAEEFINLTKIINTLANITQTTKEIFPKETIDLILNKAKTLKGGLSYKELRKILKLDNHPEITFKDRELNYIDKDTEKKIFVAFPKYHRLKEYLSNFEEEFNSLEVKTLDEIANIIAFNRSQKHLKEKLSKLPISEAMQEKLSLNQLGFDKTISLSLKTLYQIIPLMREGKRYDEAIEESKLVKISQDTKKGLLPPLSETIFADTLNPVVNRAIAQYRKVVNSVIKKYGPLHKIHIEFTRDVKKSFKDRREIEKEQMANRNLNAEAERLCQEIGLKKGDILKVKLWIRQDELCIYSGKKITIEDLRGDTLEIDHIYPLSRSLDDSQNNKVLVFKKLNRDKNNKTPYEWIGEDNEKWEALGNRVNSMKKLPKSVKKKIMNTRFANKNVGSRGEFLARNLVDTGYINRLVSQYTSQYLEFLPLSETEDTSLRAGSKGSKKHILTLGGSLTSILRHYWGLKPKNRDTHLHHFEDSLIIALATDANIKSLTDDLKLREEGYKKGKKFKKPQIEPIKDFRAKLEQATESIFVSKNPRRNVTGALHEQTIRKFSDFYGSYGGKEGVKRAIELGKIREINGGVVDNGAIVRTDVFRSKNKGKYYSVPIYTYDFAIGRLPNKAIVQGKDKKGVIKDWLEMDENYEFCFSLFKDDLVQIQTKKMDKSMYAYYGTVKSSSGTMSFKHHSNHISSDEEKDFFKETPSGFVAQSCGIQDLKIFKKCIISPLGEISEARFEPRKNVRLKTTKKRS